MLNLLAMEIAKIDFKKELKHLYKPSLKEVCLVNVPTMNFIMVDGKGDPNTSQEYREAVEALFGVSYTLKFMIKKGELGIDYGVLPLESLWWIDDMTKFSVDNKEDWQWRAMIMQPEYVTQTLFDRATQEVKRKKNLPALSKLRFESFAEGKAAQIMHLGPFSEEGPTIEKVHNFIMTQGYQLSGKHHEIYLSDIRKAAPEKWKTVVRQPYK